MVTRKRLYSETCFVIRHLQAYLTNITNAIQLWEGRIMSVPNQSQLTSSKNNEILEINDTKYTFRVNESSICNKNTLSYVCSVHWGCLVS